MGDAVNYFDVWAPYWSYLEDNNFDIESINNLCGKVSSPVLIVGAGQGIIVEQLKRNGFEVDGIDLSPTMIRFAKQRRSLDLIEADARKMPFDDRAYQSAIIATGVIDYMDDKDDIASIIREAKRVTRSTGQVLIAFYRFHPRVEEFTLLLQKMLRFLCNGLKGVEDAQKVLLDKVVRADGKRQATFGF